MNLFFSHLVTVAACCCLAACQSGSGAKDEPVARLEIRAPFESIVYQVKNNACSVQEVGHNGRILHESQRTLSHEEAATFWASLEQMQVRQWRRDYGAAAGDGRNPVTAWKLVTRQGKAATSSQGIGAFPSDERPNAPSTDTSTRFQNVYSLFQGTVSPQATEVASHQSPKALPAEDANAVH